MKVLVTGATGFIGANVVRHLLRRGVDVRCVVRKPNLCLEGLPVELLTPAIGASDTEIDGLARAMDGCEQVYHVAGIFDPSPGGEARMAQVHVEGTRGICAAAVKAGVKRVLVCSSSITVGYGPKDAPGDEDSPIDPDRLYGKRGALRAYYETKLESERIALTWPGVEAVVVNPDFIIGAWDIKPTSGQLILTMAQKPVPVYPRGGKCFQDGDDCAIGHILAMESGLPGQRYLLGNENLSYQEFMGIVAGVVGRRAPFIPLPRAAISTAALIGGLLQRVDAHRFAGLEPHVLRSMQEERYRSGARAWALGVPRTPMVHAVEKAHRWFRDHKYL